MSTPIPRHSFYPGENSGARYTTLPPIIVSMTRKSLLSTAISASAPGRIMPFRLLKPSCRAGTKLAIAQHMRQGYAGLRVYTRTLRFIEDALPVIVPSSRVPNTSETVTVTPLRPLIGTRRQTGELYAIRDERHTLPAFRLR